MLVNLLGVHRHLVYIYFKQLLRANLPLQANIFGKDSKLDLMSSKSSANRPQLGKEIVLFHWVNKKKREKNGR